MKLSINENKLFIASDHAGFELKKYILEKGPSINDLGTNSSLPIDYPEIADKLCDALREHNNSLGILICSTGIGMSIAANRYTHIRAALCYNNDAVLLARKHNNANVLVLGARFVTNEKSIEFLESFLSTTFEGGRHLARVEKLSHIGR